MENQISNDEKRRCRRLLTYAVRRGDIIVPKKCTICNMDDYSLRELSGHHFDYTKPLDVVWACIGCHGIIHSIISDKIRNGLKVEKDDILIIAKSIWENKKSTEIPQRMYTMVGNANNKSAIFNSKNNYHARNCERRIHIFKKLLESVSFNGIKSLKPLILSGTIVSKFKNINISFEPSMNDELFMSELLDFYEKYHCPECHAATVVKERHHKC